MYTITYKQIFEKKACQTQLDLFEKTFGASAEVTYDNAVKYANDFSWLWAGNRLLTPKQIKYFRFTTKIASDTFLCLSSGDRDEFFAGRLSDKGYDKKTTKLKASMRMAYALAFYNAYCNNF